MAIELTFTPIQVAESQALADFSRETFIAAYAAQCDPLNFDRYLRANLTANVLADELTDERFRFFWAKKGEAVVGFFKLVIAPDDHALALQIARFYVAEDSKGQGIGKEMMEFIMDFASNYRFAALILDVWKENPGAIRFYEKMGFAIVGTTFFQLGEELHEDWVMQAPIIYSDATTSQL